MDGLVPCSPARLPGEPALPLAQCRHAHAAAYRGRPVTAAPVGAVLRVRLMVRSAQDLYDVRVEDPLPAGAEAVDPTLLTTSQLHSGGYCVPPHTRWPATATARTC